MKAYSTQEAWNMANEIFPTDYEKDEASSQRAGYPVYRSTAEEHYYFYICDLNDRLEVNMDGRSINIWIRPDPVQGEETEERCQVIRRIRRLTAWFAEEMMDQEEKGRKAREEFEKACAGEPGKQILMVDCHTGNAKCMKDCMKACIRADRYIRDKENEVDDWQLAGINAMFDKANENRTIPFGLPYAINGILLILEDKD